jgi:midasin (ATPase involved in ribosome maturation)
MEFSQKVVSRLETMFAKECQTAIDILAYQGMSEEQYLSFETSLNTFFKYDDLKDFITESLIKKTKEVARRFKPSEPESWLSFRRLAKLIVKFGDRESLSITSSFLLTGKLPFHFFVLLEEIVEGGLETHEYQKIFESLIVTHQYDLDIINQYMKIVQQDSYGLTKRLLQNSNYGGLVRYIRSLSMDAGRKKILQEQVAPSILENFTGDRTHYMGITMSITECGTDCVKELLHDSNQFKDCEEFFGKYLTSNHSSNLPVIKNFISYLEINNPKSIPSVEEAFLQRAGIHILIQYALQVPTSNKRKVLMRLIELGDEDYVVEFIKKFPNFRSLMPML